MLLNRIRGSIYNAIQYYEKKFSISFPEYANFKYLKKVFYLHYLYNLIENIDGDIVECGVAYGNGLITFASLSKLEGKKRRIYGFDSFKGFPTPSIFDKSARSSHKGEYANANYNYVKRVIKNSNAGDVVLVRGYLEDTAKEYNGRIALLYIDLDLYEGYRAALNYLYEKVVPGGVVAFDEYDDPKWPGAKKAVDEFLLKNSQIKLLKDQKVHKFYFVKN